eukprot:4636237-Amphidinium_carterae.1
MGADKQRYRARQGAASHPQVRYPQIPWLLAALPRDTPRHLPSLRRRMTGVLPKLRPLGRTTDRFKAAHAAQSGGRSKTPHTWAFW